MKTSVNQAVPIYPVRHQSWNSARWTNGGQLEEDMRILHTCAVAVALILTLTSCASMAHHAPMPGAAWQIIQVESDPAGAEVYLDGRQVGVTPARVAVKRRRTDARLRIQKDGYAAQEVPLARRMSGWIAGDVALFPIYAVHPNGFADNPESRGQKAAIGLGLMAGALALDVANGAAYEFPARVRVTLTLEGARPQQEYRFRAVPPRQLGR